MYSWYIVRSQICSLPFLGRLVFYSFVYHTVSLEKEGGNFFGRQNHPIPGGGGVTLFGKVSFILGGGDLFGGWFTICFLSPWFAQSVAFFVEFGAFFGYAVCFWILWRSVPDIFWIFKSPGFQGGGMRFFPSFCSSTFFLFVTEDIYLNLPCDLESYSVSNILIHFSTIFDFPPCIFLSLIICTHCRLHPILPVRMDGRFCLQKDRA